MGAGPAAASPGSTCWPRWRRAPSTSSVSVGTAPPPGWRSGPRTSTPSARPSRPTPPRCSARRTCGAPSGSTRWSAAPISASTWPRSWGAWRPSGWAILGCGCWFPPPGCSDVRTMGEGKHSRFSLHSGSHRALGGCLRHAEAWGGGRRGGRRGGAARGQPLERFGRAAAWCCASCIRRDAERAAASPRWRRAWWERFEAELVADPDAASAPADAAGDAPERRWSAAPTPRRPCIAELVSSGAACLAVAADAAGARLCSSGPISRSPTTPRWKGAPVLDARVRPRGARRPAALPHRRAARRRGLEHGRLSAPRLGRGRGPFALAVLGDPVRSAAGDRRGLPGAPGRRARPSGDDLCGALAGAAPHPRNPRAPPAASASSRSSESSGRAGRR